MAIEYIVPNDDNTDGFWTNSDSNTTDLYSYVDNGISGGTPDDTTYIESSSANDTVVLDLQTIAGTRTADSDIPIRYRSQGFFITHKVSLYEGATKIWESLDQTSQGSFTESTLTVPGASGNNITDYSNLNIRVENIDGGSPELRVSEIELEFDTDGGGGGGGSAVSDFIRFENGCMSDFRGMVDIRS